MNANDAQKATAAATEMQSSIKKKVNDIDDHRSPIQYGKADANEDYYGAKIIGYC